MAGDVVYRVVAKLDTEGDLTSGSAKSKLSELDSQVTKIGSGLQHIGESMLGTFTNAVERVAEIGFSIAKLGAGMAAAGAAFGVRFNDQMEQTQMSLASIFGAGGATKNMEEGMLAAGKVMEKIRKDSEALPISFEDVAMTMKMISTSGFQSGASVGAIERLATTTSAFANLEGISGRVAAREVAMILEGRATSANLIANRLGSRIPHGKDLKSMDPSERFEVLKTAMEAYTKPSADTFSTSFKALYTTLKNEVQMELLAPLTSTLFSHIKDTMKEASMWLREHGEEAKTFVSRFGTMLAHMWDIGIAKIKEWGPILYDFAEKARDKFLDMWAKIEPIVTKLSALIKDSLGSGGPLSQLGGIGAAYGVAKLTEGGIGAGKAFGPAGAGVGAVIGAALGIDFLFIANAIEKSDYAANTFHKTLGHLEAGWAKLSAAFSEGTILNELATKWGEFLITMTNFWAGLFEVLASGINMISEKYTEMDKIIHPSKYMKDAYDLATEDSLADIRARRNFEPGGPVKLGLDPKDLDSLTGRKDPKGGGGTHIGKIEIRVEQSGDPSRVARRVMEELQDLKRYPRSSKFVPNYSIPNR